MNYKSRNFYYFSYLNEIGGVESHLYYLAKKYGDRDWCVLYRSGDAKQIARISKLVRTIQVRPNDRFECERFFATYDTSILKQVDAKEIYFVIHADYQSQIDNGTMSKGSNKANPNFKYLAVCEVAKQGFDPEANADVVYMPIELDKCEDPILLLSATRLSPEKGYNRMKTLAKELDRAGVNYIWHIFTNKEAEDISPNVYFFRPRLDITKKMKLYDGFVQLSDSEAYCVSIQEALMNGLHLIATPLPLISEMNAQEFTITLPFDMKDIGEQVEQIRNIKQLPKVKYKPPKDKWGKYLQGKGNYMNDYVTVQATKGYAENFILDSELGRVPKAGDTWQISKDRLIFLQQYERDHRVKLINVL